MKSIREAVHDIIEQRILPWIERDGISNLLLPEQITPEHCAEPAGSKRLRDLRYRYRYRDPELVIGLSGKSVYWIDGKEFIFTAGRILLLPGHTPRGVLQTTMRFKGSLDPARPRSTLWMRSYPSSVWVQIARTLEEKDVVEMSQPYLLMGRYFGMLTNRLLQEVRSAGPNYARVGRAILIEFMERCVQAAAISSPIDIPAIPPRRHRSTSLTTGRPKVGSKQATARVQAAEEFIYHNYHMSISMDDIADAADASSQHLCRQFKDATGVTPMQYLLDVRLSAARELLLTDMSIAELATQVGFEDASYFGRVFRRANGSSPLKYRRKMAKSAERHAST